MKLKYMHAYPLMWCNAYDGGVSTASYLVAVNYDDYRSKFGLVCVKKIPAVSVISPNSRPVSSL